MYLWLVVIMFDKLLVKQNTIKAKLKRVYKRAEGSAWNYNPEKQFQTVFDTLMNRIIRHWLCLHAQDMAHYRLLWEAKELAMAPSYINKSWYRLMKVYLKLCTCSLWFKFMGLYANIAKHFPDKKVFFFYSRNLPCYQHNRSFLTKSVVTGCILTKFSHHCCQYIA